MVQSAAQNWTFLVISLKMLPHSRASHQLVGPSKDLRCCAGKADLVGCNMVNICNTVADIWINTVRWLITIMKSHEGPGPRWRIKALLKDSIQKQANWLRNKTIRDVYLEVWLTVRSLITAAATGHLTNESTGTTGLGTLYSQCWLDLNRDGFVFVDMSRLHRQLTHL